MMSEPFSLIRVPAKKSQGNENGPMRERRKMDAPTRMSGEGERRPEYEGDGSPWVGRAWVPFIFELGEKKERRGIKSEQTSQA
jgi:hypothetical protein